MKVRYTHILAAALFLLLPPGWADVRTCGCDVAHPETLDTRECSLCRLAESQPADAAFFAVRDTNPNKPNRWLALPRSHARVPEELSGMTPAERTAYWTYAIGKGRELFGDGWGLAINNLIRRSQCHMHIHIGKLNEGVEDENFVTVDGPADIPLPKENDGMLVHPAGGKLHVHWGNDAPELLLQR